MHTSHKFLVAVAAVFSVACEKTDRPIKTASAAEVTTSVSDSAANARGHSQVRFVNAVPSGKDVGVKIGEVTLFSGVQPSSVTDYREIGRDIAKFTATSAGVAGGVAVPEKDHVLLDGRRYTVFLINEDVAHSTLRVVKDETSSDSTKAHIRIIHAAAGGPELDVGVVGQKDKLFTGINFKSEAGYKDVAPGTVTLTVYPKGENKVLLSIPLLKLKYNQYTTIVINGSTKLRFFKFTDSPMQSPANK